MTRSLEQALLQGADVSALAGNNLVVNGFHNISQEVGSALIGAGGGGWASDQWQTYIAGPGISRQQVANPFPTMKNIPFGYRLTVTTAKATPAAGDETVVYQNIEGTRWGRLGWGSIAALPLTVAFVARSNIPLIAYLRIGNAAPESRNFLRKITLAANADTFVTFTIPPELTGTWVSDTASSAVLAIELIAAAPQLAAADVWLGANVRAGTDISNFGGTVGNTFTMSAVVALPGIVPISALTLPLLARSLDDEYRLATRYYWTVSEQDQFAIFGRLINMGSSPQSAVLNVRFPSIMRATPSIVLSFDVGDTASQTTPTVVSAKPAGVTIAQNNIPAGQWFDLNTLTTSARI